MNLGTIPGQGFNQTITPVEARNKSTGELAPEQLEAKVKRDKIDDVKQGKSGCSYEPDLGEVWD